MKRVLTILLLAALLLSLTACGSKDKDPVPSGTDAQTQSQAAGPEQGGSPDDSASQAEETEPPKVTDPPADGEVSDSDRAATPAQLKAIAESFKGRDVNELLEAIGQPLSADYAQSCLGPGEDGELRYDGFTVYTYREDGVETVTEVY